MGFGVYCSSPALDRGQVSHGLNLTLELKNPDEMPRLLGVISSMKPKTDWALKELHFVHFARFLPARDSKALLVITEFDGDLEPYVMDFALAIGDVFDAILGFIKDAPPKPVREDPRAFWAFIQLNNRVLGMDDYPLFSAYPDKTVLEIIGRRADLPPPVTDAAPSEVAYDDVQGNILRAYRAGRARHFALAVRSARAARQLLGAMLSGDACRSPQISTAREWPKDTAPDHLLNIGFTAAGLKAMGVPDEELQHFPGAFMEGPAHPARARNNGDTDDSAPPCWILGGTGQTVHLLISLYVEKSRPALLDDITRQLQGMWRDGGLIELSRHDATALPDGQVHFGYREGMAQPRIAGVRDPVNRPDMQPRASVGEFLLGRDYFDVYGGASLGSLPQALCQNATFAAVRLLEQDVDGFEKLLDHASRLHQLDRELIAAKLMGRWRDGTPLSRQPAQPSGAAGSNSNAFDFAPSAEYPLTHDDHDGGRCPIGAHIRRMNPRSAMVVGRPHSRRIIRRGMPYGPAWTPGDVSNRVVSVQDGGEPVERGLFGFFICADLERQFEFLMGEWGNGDISAAGIRGTQDPFIGEQSKGGGVTFPVEDGTRTVRLEVPRLVKTRGSLYLLLPGICGLRHLVEGTGGLEPATPPARHRFDPDAFDPTAAAFLADPYPFFALFRSRRPVHHVRRHDSFWVFSHELVTRVCNEPENYLKRPKDPRQKGEPQGLFFMDPPRHTLVRPLMDTLLGRAIADVEDIVDRAADEALRDILDRGGDRHEFDLVSDYARRVPKNVLMAVMGVPAKDWAALGADAETVMLNSDVTLPEALRLRGADAARRIVAQIKGLVSGCPRHLDGGTLLGLMRDEGGAGGMSPPEMLLTGLHFIMGGYLSTEFLLTTGLWNLLRDGGAPMQRLRASQELLGNAIEEMARFDTPFQMADRYASRELELGGVGIPKGARVTVVYGSANRDASPFGRDADSFDITRMPSPHSHALGHGMHACIGAPLVRKVAPIALRKLLKQFPDLSLSQEGLPACQTNPYFRTFTKLVLRGN